jgi:hypothetical protein
MQTRDAIIDGLELDVAQIEELADIVADTAEDICGPGQEHPFNGRLHFCAKALRDYAARLYEATERLRSVSA